jgi:hypothetical protein
VQDFLQIKKNRSRLGRIVSVKGEQRSTKGKGLKAED